MPSLRPKLIMAATAFCLMGCGNLATGLQQKDYNSSSLRLKKDMSEQEVAATIGSSPDKVDMVTCVDHSGSPWQCRTWIYYGGHPKNSLRLVFYQADDKQWRVAAWQIY